MHLNDHSDKIKLILTFEIKDKLECVEHWAFMLGCVKSKVKP